MRRSFALIIVVTVFLILYLVYDFLNTAGYFKKIIPHGFSQVEKIQLPVSGPEDLTLDSITGNLFISADDRRANQLKPGQVNGKILLLNLKDSSQTIYDLTPDLPDFHPHGIALWRADSGRIYLFAVNHHSDKTHAIERFEYKAEQLIHLESISDMDKMTSPNDLVATGARSFYVTNDHYYSKEGLSRTLEDYLQRAISFVNYYDGRTFTTVVSGIAYANGIQANADRTELYVASTTGRKILIYEPNRTSGALKLKQEIIAETGVDNIETDGDGNLWIGCHPQLLKFVAHAANASNYSPSQIIRLKRNHKGDFIQQEVFLNDGATYSGSTTGVPFKNMLYIGSVFEPALLKIIIDDKDSSPLPY